MSADNLISTKEVDYLEEDKPIRGQNYVCLSFLSPENVIKNKEVYFFEKFLAKFSSDMDELLNGMAMKYKDEADTIKVIRENNAQIFDGKELQESFRFYKRVNGETLEKEYLEQNNFQTTVRGIKVRGVFETLKEAQVRAETLRRLGDKNFDIFVGQVGVWCPWSPNPEDMQNQEYAESQLNTLMKEYQDNMTLRDEFYEMRKREKMEDAQKKLKENLEKKDPLTERKELEMIQETEQGMDTSETTEDKTE